MLPTGRLPLLDFDPAPLAAEAERIEDAAWIRHFNDDDFVGDWAAVPLRSVGGSPAHIKPMPRAYPLFAPTPYLRGAPHLAAALASFGCPVGSARLLRLGPKSRILEHSDPYLGHEDGEMRIHLVLATSPDVSFFLDGERLPMLAGQCWYVDVRRPHRVDNDGATSRIHLVVDCAVDDWLLARLPRP